MLIAVFGCSFVTFNFFCASVNVCAKAMVLVETYIVCEHTTRWSVFSRLFACRHRRHRLYVLYISLIVSGFFLYPFSSFFSYFLLLSILSFRFFSLVQNRFLIHLARYNQNDGMQNIIKQKKWKRQEYSNSKKKSANTYKYHMQRRAREAQFFFYFRLCRYYKYA